MIYCEECGAILDFGDEIYTDELTKEDVCSYCWENRKEEAKRTKDSDWLKINCPELDNQEFNDYIYKSKE